MGKRRAGVEPQARHLSLKKKPTIWAKIGIALLLVLVLVLGAGAAAYLKLQNNIQSEDLYQPGETQTSAPPEDDKSPIDILVVGTDTRSGADSRYGSVDDSGGEGFADVMMAVHVSGDRQRVTVVSIPRDTVAPFPGCVDAAGGDAWPAMDAQMLNAALKMGGPSCLRKTLGDLTGISFGHFMVADFNAVVDLSNTVGGVEVCVDQPIDDLKSHLKLPAGNSTIQGEDALAFLRTRSAFGDSSDLARITAQQGFLSSLVRKIKSEDTLTNIPKLYSIADTVTKNVTLDKSLANIPALLQLASRLKDVDTQNVSFVTVPNEAYIYDSNRVQIQEEPAKRLFQAIIADQDIAKSVGPQPSGDSSAPAQTETSATEPTAEAPEATLNAPSETTPPAVTEPLNGQNADQQTCQKASGF